MRLPRGTSLVFQMHYTPIGKPTTDRTSIGLVFAKEPPAMPLGGTALVNGSLHIPAGAASHRVDAEMTLDRDLLLFSMTPHTHVRGVRWHYDAILPDDTRDAAALGAQLRLRVAARVPVRHADQAARRHDNQGVGVVRATRAANKSNPDASKDVWWGDQTWEEMIFTSFTWHVRPAAPPRSSCECYTRCSFGSLWKQWGLPRQPSVSGGSPE